MKQMCILLAVCAAYAAPAQVTNRPAPAKEESLQRSIAEMARKNPPTIREEKANEIRGSRATYSGIVVSAIRTDNRLQLVNPAAPARYGSSEDNTVLDPITRKPSGLKIFSIDF